jgi:DNA polymerase-3 subunit delta
LFRWVRSQAEQLGHRISEEAVSVLLERVGPSLRELKLELQKLTLGQNQKRSIGEEDVLALTGDIRSESLFELPMAVGHLNLRETLRLLGKNLQQGDPPLLLLSLIVRQLRLIWRAQELRAEGRSKKEIETKLKVLPRTTGEFWKQVESFPLSTLNQLWPLTLQADQELKSSRLERGLLLEKYLWNLHLLESRKIREPKGK